MFGSKKFRLSARRKPKHANLIELSKKRKLRFPLRRNLSHSEKLDRKKNKVLQGIKCLERKYGITFSSASSQNNHAETESVQNFKFEENGDEFILPDVLTAFEADNTNNELIVTEPSVNDNGMSSPLDTIKIKVEPGEEEVKLKCQSDTNSLPTSSSCKDFNNSDKNCMDPFGNDNEVLMPMDVVQIKVEPCEEEIEQNFQNETSSLPTPCSCKNQTNSNEQCVCSCAFNESSILSSYNVPSHLSLTDFETLFKVITYLDDHANEDKFDAAEKYYTLKLKSVMRSQQMLARKLINKVLVEAEKGNLSSKVVLSHNLSKGLPFKRERDLQTHVMQNVAYNTYADEEQADTKLQLPERGYLYPAANKVLNTMKESLIKCMVQDRSVKSYAHQLRSLSVVQYSFADRLINEILSEAVFRHLRASSDILVPKKLPSKRPATSSSNEHISSMESLSNRFENVPILILDSSKHSFKKPVSSLPNEFSNKNLETLSIQEGTAQDSSLSIPKASFIPMSSQTLKESSHASFAVPSSTSIGSSTSTVIPLSNQSNFATVKNSLTNSIPTVNPNQVYLIPVTSPGSSTSNKFYMVSSLGNIHLPNQEATIFPTTSQITRQKSHASSLFATFSETGLYNLPST